MLPDYQFNMLSRNELRFLLALQQTPNLGDISIKKLLNKVGSAEGIFDENKKNLARIEGIGAFKLKDFNPKLQLSAAEEELEFIETEKINCVYYKEPDYPHRLNHCQDAPILLFSKGKIRLRNKRIISIVGTRHPTLQGKETCENLISELAPLDPVIVSGFAYGIDITSHRAAVANNLQTVACLAHGLDQIYPKSHARFVGKLLAHGGLLTEFWSSDPFDRKNFIKRNRIIAGLSEATIVIESGEKGGSLVTADIANSYNRDVFAVPGRITDSQSAGCNYLIKSQQANLLESAADLIYMLGWDLEKVKRESRQTQLFPDLTAEEAIVVEFLKTRDRELLDTIALGCSLPVFKVATILLELELKGVVRPLPGKLFQLT